MLPNVADLDGRAVVELLLKGEIPLFGECWLHVRIPHTEKSTREGISWWGSYDTL